MQLTSYNTSCSSTFVLIKERLDIGYGYFLNNKIIKKKFNLKITNG